MTLGILRVWSPGQVLGVGAGAIGGLVLASELGLRAGLPAHTVPEGLTAMSGIGNFSRRNPQIGRWWLNPVPVIGTFDECWVEFEPGAYDASREILPARFTGGSTEASVRSYRHIDAFTRDPAAEWRAQPQRYGWLAMPVVVCALALIASSFRRAESGLYLTVGTRRIELAIMAAAEQWPLVVLGWALGFTYAVAAQVAWSHAPTCEVAGHGALTSGLAALALLALLPWASLLVARGNIASMLKDR